jgi:hypothetical protein
MGQKCFYEHVEFQVPDDEWVCPGCGAKSQYVDDDGVDQDGWVISDSCNFDCEKLHVEDYLECESCGMAMSGAEYSKWYSEQKGMIQCPCCKGKGVVKKSDVKR